MGTLTYIPQIDPHPALNILNIHKWGKIFFKKFSTRVKFRFYTMYVYSKCSELYWESKYAGKT